LNPPTKKNLISLTEFDNLWVIDYLPFIKGLRYLPGFLQRKLIKVKYNQLQKLTNIRFDIVWSFDNSVFFDFSVFPKSILKISHMVDMNQNFQIAKAAKTADICFGTSSPIISRLNLYNKNSFFINHGFNNCKSNRKVTDS